MERKKLNLEKKNRSLACLDHKMRDSVVGQGSAIDAILDVYQMHLAGLTDPRRPIGNFLFLGPTGSGKTYVVEMLAEKLLGDRTKMIKVDCAEFQHSHEIARLLGSPPGYLGHRETKPVFSNEKLAAQHTDKVKVSLVLFDEIEKASDALWNLLLGVLDKATLTLGDNTAVDFSNTMIFLTSNLGAREMEKAAGDSLGFAPKPGQEMDLSKIGMDAARKRFTPEFMNRLDYQITFSALTDTEIRKIVDLQIEDLRWQISLGGHKAVLDVSDAMKDHLVEVGVDRRYGARFLKRAIHNDLKRPIARVFSNGEVKAGGDYLLADWVDGKTEIYSGGLTELKAA